MLLLSSVVYSTQEGAAEKIITSTLAGENIISISYVVYIAMYVYTVGGLIESSVVEYRELFLLK